MYVFYNALLFQFPKGVLAAALQRQERATQNRRKPGCTGNRINGTRHIIGIDIKTSRFFMSRQDR